MSPKRFLAIEVPFEHFLPSCSLACVQWLETMIVWVLLAFWLPASSHALLEHSGIVNADGAGHHSSGKSLNHDAADGVCRVELNDHAPPAPEFVLPLPLAAGFLPLLHASDQQGREILSPDPPPGTAPPQLPRRWQFTFRTALLARAPSLIV